MHLPRAKGRKEQKAKIKITDYVPSVIGFFTIKGYKWDFKSIILDKIYIAIL